MHVMEKIITIYLVKKKLNLANLFSFLLVFVFTNVLAQVSISKKEKHYSSKDVYLFDRNIYSLSDFEAKQKKNISLDVLKMIDEEYLSHPDLGYSVHPYHKDAIELVDKRDQFHSTYLMPDGTSIFSSSATPLNYIDENGWFREIVYELDKKPIVNNVYRAGNQPIPKTIDALTGRTSFETPLGNIAINQNSKLRFFDGVNEVGQVHSLNTSSSKIGKNGYFVSNAFPNVDMQVILMKNGSVKTNYIVKNRDAINSNAEFMVFEDVISLPKGMRFDYDTDMGIHNGNEQDWEGRLVVRNENNEDVFHYMLPFIYDDNYTDALMNMPLSTYSEATESVEEPGVDSDAFTYGAYRVEKINETTYKVSVVVKTEWLLAEERVFPMVIDPVTFTGTSLTFTAGNFCARRVSGTTPSDTPGTLSAGNPGLYTGVGCYSTTTLIPAGYMLITTQPVRAYAGYITRGCAASSTWMKYYGPCGMFPREAGFFYFCNTNLTNVDCGTAGGGNPMEGILSRCNLTGGEPCSTPTPPLCTDRTVNFSICYQTRCFSNAAGTCATTSTQYPAGTNASYVEAGIANFRVDVLGEKITTTLAGNPVSGTRVCPNFDVPLTLTTRWGVPKNLSTSNCTDQMGGTYTWTATCTGGTLSAYSGLTNTTGGFATTPIWNSGAVSGTYTIEVKVCNTDCPTPEDVMCDIRTLTYTVGEAIPPIVSDLDLCNNIAGVPVVQNSQAGYTYTWYTNATGTSGAMSPPSYPAVNGTTQTYSVRATSPCASDLVTFTITWGPLSDPVGTNANVCPGDLATLTANCGGACRWYTASAGGTALTSTAPITIGVGSLTVNPVSTATTYYVENYVSAGCISTRIPLSISLNGLTVTTNPTVFDPLCSPTTAQFTSSVTGNTDFASVEVATTNSAEVMNELPASTAPCTGGDCTTSNSGQQTITGAQVPPGVLNPMDANSIQEVCFTISGANWCGKDTRMYLTSPDGTTFTLYGGREKNSKSGTTGAGAQGAGPLNICFSDLATAAIPAPTTGSAVRIGNGTYLPDGGSLSGTFAGENPFGTWTLNIVDVLNGDCGNGTASLSNFTITFGVEQLPTYSWSGTDGSVNVSTISNPVYTPPAGSYEDTWTVTVTDATGCIGTATVDVVCSVNLPVTLLSFYGVMGDRENYLYWKTASEEQSDYIEIQRSANGIDFDEIGKLAAANNSNTLKDYEFTDKTRLKGLNYYRLKMVDLNGEYEYSSVISLETKDDKINLELIPNPASSMIDIKYQMNFETETDIKVYDSRGALVTNLKLNSKKGFNNYVLDLDNYSKGVYSVVLNNDGVISTSRFIKQ
jgi:hypothetical protein